MSKLRDLQNIPETGGHLYVDRDDGVICWIEGDRRHQLVVTSLKNQERAIVLIRLILTLNYLVTPLSHAEHTHHVSDWQRLNENEVFSFLTLYLHLDFRLRQELKESLFVSICLSVCPLKVSQSSSLSQVNLRAVSGLFRFSFSVSFTHFVGQS